MNSPRCKFPNSKQKGDLLERAVACIEEALLRSYPELGASDFRISTKVRNGRHEIDVVVEILGGTHYGSKHLIECKNWGRPVGKNEVIILQRKIEFFGANKGSIIANSFTSGAMEEARGSRVDLVYFSDEEWLPSEAIRMASSIIKYHAIRFSPFFFKGSLASDFDWNEEAGIFEGRLILFREFLLQLSQEYLSGQCLGPNADYSEYSGRRSFAADFLDGDLVVRGARIARLNIYFDFTLFYRPMPLVASYSIEKRGRFARYEIEQDDERYPDLSVEIIGK